MRQWRNGGRGVDDGGAAAAAAQFELLFLTLLVLIFQRQFIFLTKGSGKLRN